MKRLTKCENGRKSFDCYGCEKLGGDCDPGDCNKQAVSRLESIENVLGGTYDLERIGELAEADREGRCLILPFNKEGIVYLVGLNKVIECIVYDVDVRCVKQFKFDIFLYLSYTSDDDRQTLLVVNWTKRNGKDVFLSRGAAEKAFEVNNV